MVRFIMEDLIVILVIPVQISINWTLNDCWTSSFPQVNDISRKTWSRKRQIKLNAFLFGKSHDPSLFRIDPQSLWFGYLLFDSLQIGVVFSLIILRIHFCENLPEEFSRWIFFEKYIWKVSHEFLISSSNDHLGFHVEHFEFFKQTLEECHQYWDLLFSWAFWFQQECPWRNSMLDIFERSWKSLIISSYFT